jgi:hypothetical protein
MTGPALECPSCGRAHDPESRFCSSCGTPLVPAGGLREAELTERQARARKVKPQYAEGPLVSVAGARQLPEAEFIQGLLLEEGVPSTLRRSRGFDVPEMLAAGPRDVLVPASGVDVARDVLLQSDLAPREGSSVVGPGPRPARVLLVLLAVVALVALITLVGTALQG